VQRWPGSETEIPCEVALLAMGLVYPQHDGLLPSLKLNWMEKAMERLLKDPYHTNISKYLPPAICPGDSRQLSGPYQKEEMRQEL
jgi:hypothetical protein